MSTPSIESETYQALEDLRKEHPEADEATLQEMLQAEIDAQL